MTDDRIYARHPSVATFGQEPLYGRDAALAVIDDAATHDLATVGLEGFELLGRGRLPRSIADFSDLREACWTRTIERCRVEARSYLQTLEDRALVFSIVLLSEEEWT